MKRRNSIHINEAMQVLTDRKPHNLKAWKMETGEVLELNGWTTIGRWTRGGVIRLVNPVNGQKRSVRKVMIHEIDNMKIFW